MDQRKAVGNTGYLMAVIFDRNDIWIATNEIFYTTANAVQMRGKTFLNQNGIKYGELHAECWRSKRAS